MDLLAQIVEANLTEPNSKFKGKDLAKMVTRLTQDLLPSSLQDTDRDVNVMNFLPVLMDEYFHYQVCRDQWVNRSSGMVTCTVSDIILFDQGVHSCVYPDFEISRTVTF